LGAERLVPLDDEAALREVPPLDVLADTVGHEPTLKLLPKIKKGGRLASVVGAPEEARALNVRVEAMMTQPDARRMQQLAEDVAAKRLILPVARVMRFRGHPGGAPTRGARRHRQDCSKALSCESRRGMDGRWPLRTGECGQ
jgi:hypothetical protein